MRKAHQLIIIGAPSLLCCDVLSVETSGKCCLTDVLKGKLISNWSVLYECRKFYYWLVFE